MPGKAGRYTLDRRFAYRDEGRNRTIFVPSKIAPFETDLASVPMFATWLVPKDGTHTPAALLHDALVGPPGEPPSYEGPYVSREEADLIFREAMRELGVRFVRRWMMWAAVSLATLMTPGPSRGHWYFRVVVPLVVTALVLIGLASVLDLVDIHKVWLVPTDLPWMGDRPATAELAGGAAAALVAALVATAMFGRRVAVGLVTSLTVIPFAFPLAVVGAFYAAYLGVEVAISTVIGERIRTAPSARRRPAQPLKT